MKLTLLTLSVMMVGCLKPLPPVPEPPRVVVVMQVPEPPPLIIVEEVDAGPPVKTWMLQNEVDAFNKAREEAEKYGQCDCLEGDPLCDCLP